MKHVKKLNNPVWYSLSETHQRFAIEYDNNIKFYYPEYCPFGGCKQPALTAENITAYSALADNFFIVGEKPVIPNTLKLKNELVCMQMIIRDNIKVDSKEEIVKLGGIHMDDLMELVNLVQPGYFKKKTAILGNYYGIFHDKRLIAVTGERMQMDEFIEVSAVVTHPYHTGKGYANQLVSHTVNNIFNQKKIPYLHVAETNAAAIKLYEKLGFQTRRKISFWSIIR